MLKIQIISNTWKCDQCGLETVSLENPYFSIKVSLATVPNSESGQIDLCSTCIQIITIQPIVDYVESI